MPGIRPPIFYPKWSVAYRILSLSRALGWSLRKLARVMGLSRTVFVPYFRARYKYDGKLQVVPRLSFMRKLVAYEKTYARYLTKFMRNPRLWDRSAGAQRGKAVKFEPVPVVSPSDPKALGILEAFRTAEIKRLRGPLTEEDKYRLSRMYARRGQTLSRNVARKRAQERGEHEGGEDPRAGRSTDAEGGQGPLAGGVPAKKGPHKSPWLVEAGKATRFKKKEITECLQQTKE